ncbi:hypothetical protein U5B43_06690 [Campylobacter sp. 9BO]|uniref:hypothetical protein n=1 Tax=Campylobacter sp. 9BO TaxID=3424759 RepID=UPI003D356678
MFSFLEFAFAKSKTLNAIVKNDNENALKFDRSFGFAEVKKDDNFSYLRQDLHHWQEHKMTKFMQKIQSLASSFEIKIVA